MRNAHPTISRVQDTNVNMLATPPPVVGSARHSNAIPTIRFVAATPSNAGSSFESNVSSPTVHLPQAKNLPSLQENSMFGASPLAPSPSSRKRLVPKKSKLSILGGSKSKPKERDLSDVVRRVGGNSSTRGGFDIYVDPTEDPEIGEIIMVKKKKSRVGIDGLFGEATSKMMASSMSSSQTPLGDSTNAPVPLMGQVPKKQSMGAMSLLKRSTGASSVLKSEDENSKWWSISRGRKDSKPKTKDSKASDPTKTPKSALERSRFNSLDSGILLNSPITTDLPAELQEITEMAAGNAATLTFAPARHSGPGFAPAPASMSRSISFSPAITPASPMNRAHSMVPATSNIGVLAPAPPIQRANSLAPAYDNTGVLASPPLLAPPNQQDTLNASNSGSIAVRAMRSMRSLAHISSWAQLKTDKPDAQGSVKAKASKDQLKEISKVEKKDKKKTKKEKADTLAIRVVSGSSFEAGALSPSLESRSAVSSPIATSKSERGETQNLGERKKSLLGLGIGWPSTLRSNVSPVVSPSIAISPAVDEPIATRAPPSAFATHRMSTEVKRLSLESQHSTSSAEIIAANFAASTIGRARAGSRSTMESTMSNGSSNSHCSTGSSLRPLSTASSNSRDSRASHGSCGSSMISVRWDEEGLATVKEARARERATGSRRPRMESRRGSEERRRTSLASVFPETKEQIRSVSRTEDRHEQKEEEEEEEIRYPIAPRVTIETATADGHSIGDDDELDEDSDADMSGEIHTPGKLPRPRPASEQLLGKARPRGITDDDEGVLSILGAATNELASLIDRLDLEATPATPDMTPLKAASLSSVFGSEQSGVSPNESPLKTKKAQADSPLKRPDLTRANTSSVTSLRPYAQSRGGKMSTGPGDMVPYMKPMLPGQIAPWRVLNNGISPAKPSASTQARTFIRPSHRRSMTPSDVDEQVVFKPLKPLKPRARISPRPSTVTPATAASVNATPQANSTLMEVPHGSATFGRRTVREMVMKISDDVNGSPTPVFKRHHRKRSSLVPFTDARLSKEGMPSPPSVHDIFGPSLTRRSTSSGKDSLLELDPKRCSDIPADLEDILAARIPACVLEDSGEDSTSSMSDFPPSPGAPPAQPLPMPTGAPTLPPLEALSLMVPSFRLLDDEQRLSDIELTSPTTTSADEGDTKKSFEFTEEIKRLNESGASDRFSFVEQLETAFQTPSKVDIMVGLGDWLAVDANAPPVPKIPEQHLTVAAAVTVHEQNEGKRLSAVLQTIAGADSIMDTTEETEESELILGDSLDMSSSQELSMQSSIEIPRGPEPARSVGELNRQFKFGGRPSPSDMPSSVMDSSAPMTLSDIIPSPEHARRLSIAAAEDKTIEFNFLDSVEVPEIEQPRERVESDSTSRRRERNLALNALNGGKKVDKKADASFRPLSTASFVGFDSFADVRRGFEFGIDRPDFYTSATAAASAGPAPRAAHRVQDSVFSMASISSVGSVWHAGAKDPFGYSAPSRPESTSDISFSFSMSESVDDTFAYLKQDPFARRNRLDSDASTFSFHAPAPPAPGARMPLYTRPTHRRDQSTASVSSMAPPVSLYNRSFAHRRNTSTGSASSVAISYAMHGAAGGRANWARHRQNMSIDSVASNMSALRVGRPGVGDKMFESAAMDRDYGMPLTAISASPPASDAGDSRSMYSYEGASSYPYPYDSVIDAIDMEQEQYTGASDSIFEKTGFKTTMAVEDSLFERTEYQSMSVEEDSVFGGVEEDSYMPSVRPFRPVSILSTGSIHHAPRDDDTLISMIGGGHVRRLSIGSIIEGSPCARVEKDKRVHSTIKGLKLVDRLAAMKKINEKPSMPRIVEKASIASVSSVASHAFGSGRMDEARKGALKRQSLELGCLSAEGEDTSASFSDAPSTFVRPKRANRARSNTYASSGADTPPLSAADNSSVSGGSESSIDVGHLTMLLSNVSHPANAWVASRPRARGHGHRRRISQARMSRSSVYETIEEEHSVILSAPFRQLETIVASPMPSGAGSADASQVINDSVVVVDSDADSPRGSVDWNPEHGISLRKYYTLKNEADVTVEESKRDWTDTAFSMFAVQSFDPPRHPDGMKAMLEHSQTNYVELPSHLMARRIRSRTSSRASPYARAAFAAGISPNSMSSHSRESSIASITEVLPSIAVRANVLQPILVQSNIPSNISSTIGASPAKSTKSGKRSFKGNENMPDKQSKNATIRPRVNSSARRSALGWVKRPSKSSDQKENTSAGSLTNPNDSLRISRPRPRGRPTPGRSALGLKA